jgi:hypothetical protein
MNSQWGLMGRFCKCSGHEPRSPPPRKEHYAPLGPSDDVPTAPF